MFCFPNSDHMMFSREFAFRLFISQARIRTCMQSIGRHLKETILWGNITWSEMGKQNLQVKKGLLPFKLLELLLGTGKKHKQIP